MIQCCHIRGWQPDQAGNQGGAFEEELQDMESDADREKQLKEDGFLVFKKKLRNHKTEQRGQQNMQFVDSWRVKLHRNCDRVALMSEVPRAPCQRWFQQPFTWCPAGSHLWCACCIDWLKRCLVGILLGALDQLFHSWSWWSKSVDCSKGLQGLAWIQFVLFTKG